MASCWTKAIDQDPQASRHEGDSRVAIRGSEAAYHDGTPIATSPKTFGVSSSFLTVVYLSAHLRSFRERYCTRAAATSTWMTFVTGSRRYRSVGRRLRPYRYQTRPSCACPWLYLGRSYRCTIRMRDELMLWVTDLSGADVVTYAENILARLVASRSSHRTPSHRYGYSETPSKLAALDDVLRALPARA